jgi:hypothetical protein
MTPEEKQKHLEALEDMYDSAWIRADQCCESVPPEWRAAIDAFKATPVFVVTDPLKRFECIACGCDLMSLRFDKHGTTRACALCGRCV